MSSLQGLEFAASFETLDAPHWYAVHVRAKHEKSIAAALEEKGIKAFLPAASQVHRWSDRRAVIEVPLFPCYVFVHMDLASTPRLAVLRTAGVFRFVGFKHGPTPIPDVQIEAVQAVLANHLPISSCGFIKIGQKVRIRGGALDGVEGVLVGYSGARKLIISIDLIQQSMAVAVEGYDIEPA
jgi:transcription antitermination factor NusG